MRNDEMNKNKIDLSKVELENNDGYVTIESENELSDRKKDENPDFWEKNIRPDANADGVENTLDPNDLALSQRQFNLAIAGLLLYGFIINAVECLNLMKWVVYDVSYIALIIGYFVTCTLGFGIMNSSKNPYVSFVGYNLVVLPVGLVLTKFVSRFDPYIIFETCVITAMTTFLMMIAGTCFKKLFLKMADTLMVALGMILIADLTVIFGLGFVDVSYISIFASLVFSLFIAYDWSIAQQTEYTLDNAIDVTVAIYLDVVNLFIRLLGILGSDDD